MSVPWKRLLAQPASGDHIVQTYRNDRFLVDAVSLYIGKALQRSEAVVVVATPDHWKAFQSSLLANDFGIEPAVIRRQLVFADARETLEKILLNGMPDRDRFYEAVTELSQPAAAGNFKS